MANYVIDDGQNKIPGYSQDETDAAIVQGIADNLNAENIPVAEGSSTMISDALYYKPGDKLNIAGSVYCGRITGSSKAITMFIPFNKLVAANVASATINGDFAVYYSSGYESVTNLPTEGSWDITIKQNGILGVFSLNNAISVPNGTAITIMFTSSSSSLKYIEFLAAS